MWRHRHNRRGSKSRQGHLVDEIPHDKLDPVIGEALPYVKHGHGASCRGDTPHAKPTRHEQPAIAPVREPLPTRPLALFKKGVHKVSAQESAAARHQALAGELRTQGGSGRTVNPGHTGSGRARLTPGYVGNLILRAFFFSWWSNLSYRVCARRDSSCHTNARPTGGDTRTGATRTQVPACTSTRTAATGG